ARVCGGGRLPAARPGRALKRDLPQREPARELRLEWQLGADLRLQLELALVVALMVARRGHERVVEAALEVVDEVERPPFLLEREHRSEQTVAVAAALERARHGVDRHDEVLEVGVAQDDPRVAVLVGGRLDGRAGIGRGARQQLLRVVDDLLEVRGRKRLEGNAGDVPVLEPKRRLESDLSRSHGEQPVTSRKLELPLATHQRIKKSHACDLGTRASAARPEAQTLRRAAGDGGDLYRRATLRTRAEPESRGERERVSAGSRPARRGRSA